jgi:hypothetical protein
MLAVVRPADWEWPLFLHVAGALALVGGMLLVVLVFAAAARRGTVEHAAVLRRFGFWTVLGVVLPAWILMRAAGQWILDREGEPDATWVDIGFNVADLGLVLLVVLAVLSWFGMRRTRPGNPAPVAARIALVLAPVYSASLFLALWAMTAKPS